MAKTVIKTAKTPKAPAKAAPKTKAAKVAEAPAVEVKPAGKAKAAKTVAEKISAAKFETAAPKIIAISTAGLAAQPRLKKGAVLRADGLEEGGVDAVLVDAVKAGGAMHSALCALVGWKKCDRRLTRAAAIAGLKLKATRTGGDIHFEIA